MANCNENDGGVGTSKSLKRTVGNTVNRPVKVTLIADEWGSMKGGLSTINRKLAIQLAKFSSLEVSLFMPECSQEEKEQAGVHGIKLFEAQKEPGKDPSKWWTSPPQDFATDFIIGHSVKLGKQAEDIKTFCRCMWIQVAHTEPEELGIFKEYQGAIAKGEQKCKEEVELLQKADLAVGIGPKLTEVYSAKLRPQKKVFSLTPSIFKEFLNIEQAQYEGANFRVLTFGRGDPEDVSLKGFDLAAEAVAQLNDKSVFLIFLGVHEGQHEEVYKRLRKYGILESRLKVREYCNSREELANVFREVDVVIMPSRSEGFGLTALEALSAGLPILVGWNTGLAEALQNKVAFGESCIVNSNDAKDWAEAINSVRKKPKEKRLREAKSLREEYEKAYSWPEQCKELVKEMLNMKKHDAEEDNKGSDTGEENFDNPSSSKRHRACDEMPEKHAFNSCQQPSTSGASVVSTHYTCSVASTPAPASAPLVTRPKPTEASQSTVVFKEGKPGDLELDELAGKIGQKWKKLGIRLGVSNDVLDEIATNANDKPLQMLLRWRDTTSSAAPYRELYDAMCHSRVGLNNLAKEFCCKATT